MVVSPSGYEFEVVSASPIVLASGVETVASAS